MIVSCCHHLRALAGLPVSPGIASKTKGTPFDMTACSSACFQAFVALLSFALVPVLRKLRARSVPWEECCLTSTCSQTHCFCNQDWNRNWCWVGVKAGLLLGSLIFIHIVSKSHIVLKIMSIQTA